jgi:CheY-like chemotaxis protein/signal transduction histidine kinase
MTSDIVESVAKLASDLFEAETRHGVSRILHRIFSPEIGLPPVEGACLLAAASAPSARGNWEYHSLWPQLSERTPTALSEAAVSALVDSAPASGSFVLRSPAEMREMGLGEWLAPLGDEAVSAVALLPAYSQGLLMGALALGFGEGNSPDGNALNLYQIITAHTGVALGRLGGADAAHDSPDERVRRLRQRYDMLMPVLDAITDAVVFISCDREFLAINQRALELLGLPDSEAFSQWDYDERRDYCQGLLSNPGTLGALLPSRDADFTAEASGEITFKGPVPRTVYWLYRPVYGIDGTLLGRVHVASDVTEARQAQRALHDLIGVLGHEFRAALTPVMRLLPPILEDSESQFSEKTQTGLRHIQSNLEWIEWIFRGVLILAQTAHGDLRLRPGPIDVREVLNAAVAVLGPRLAGRLQEITISLPDDLPPFHADVDRFYRMLYMMIVNAIMNSEHGTRITIEAFETSSPSSLGEVVPLYDGMAWGIVRISSPGNCVSSPPPRDPAAKRHAYRSTAPADAGLGVYTANAFAQLHGGGVWVDDQPGSERSLLLGLPLTGGERHIATSEREASFVLLAIPNAHRFRDLRNHLQEAGYQVVSAGSVAHALRVIQKQPPALVLMTRGFPEGGRTSVGEFIHRVERDGITVLELAIMRRSDGSLLFSLSPNATIEQDVPPAIAHFNIIGLLRLLSEALNRITMRILVTEGRQHLSPELWNALRSHYHTVWTAHSTEQTIAMGRSLLPNLIVVAIDHPNIDCSAIVDDLRGDPRTDWIPVIGLSREPPPASPPGLEEIITHPIHADALLWAIDRSLASYSAEAAGDEGGSSPPD